MKKHIRQEVYDKCGGKCAYCGSELEVWQVDHMTPKFQFVIGYAKGDPNHIDNLQPACVTCNHYKRADTAKGFAVKMRDFHKRLARLPKNPRVPATVKRIAYMNRIADAYGITPEKPFCGIFYFETLKNTEQ